MLLKLIAKSRVLPKKATPLQKGFRSFLPRRNYNTSLNATTSLSKPQKYFYVGLGSIAVCGILSAISNGLSQKSESFSLTDGFSEETKRRLFTAYGHVLGGIGLTFGFAAYFFKAGAVQRMARMSPLAIFGGGLIMTIGASLATQMTNYQTHPVLKYSFWSIFNAAIALSLCPLAVLGGTVLLRSAIATAAIVGSMSAIAAVAPSDSFLQYGSALGIGLGILLAASLGQIFFPSPILQAVTLYGGLGLFSLFTVYDTQLILKSCQTYAPFDPINCSIGLYLNIINIFVRMAYIYGQGGKK